MAKDRRRFIAAIRDTRLRRAAMLVVVPLLLSPLLPATALALWEAARAGAHEFLEHLRWEFSSRPMRALKLGLTQMWSKDWNPTS